jgi:phosphoglucomutase/phosphomannomutase
MVEARDALEQLQAAASGGKLSQSAVANVRTWLTQPRYSDYAKQVVEHIFAGKWQELDEAFWRVIPFGTGGRRGRMYPIGCNAINDRTIGESAQGLADYVKEHFKGQPLSCAVAYDTRHRSREFAQLCSEVMVANGFKVWFLDGFRSTPELSFAVRYKHSSCGIMVTASHNPPSDNAVKVYGATGGQLLPPHDQGVIDRVMAVEDVHRTPFDEAVTAGRVAFCQEEADAAFVKAVVAQSRPGPRDLKIIYSPLHGVGASAVLPALGAAGFRDVELFGLHATPDPNFPNVPRNVANPENPRVFDAIIERARQTGAELILATDPDCDRVGCAAPVSNQPGAEWRTLTGNQIGSLLCEYLLAAGKAAGTLTPQHYVVKTLVTTELIRRIADAYGVQTVGDLLVGFKYIGGVIEDRDPAKFVLGAEESYGFLVGAHARDKDAAVASMLLAEIVARAKAEGLSLHEKVDALFQRYGCHAEKTISQTMPGAQGMEDMKALMKRFRESPPESLGGMRVARVRDYNNNTAKDVASGRLEPLAGPTGDLVMLDLAAEGNYVAVRPSGTEPQIKLYMFTYEPPQAIADIGQARTDLAGRLEKMEADLTAFAKA